MAKPKCRQCKGCGVFRSDFMGCDIVCPCVLMPDEPQAIVEPVSPNTPTGRSAADSLAEFCGVPADTFRRGGA